MSLNYTVGRTYSNSFVSLAEADDIVLNYLPYPTAEWLALSVAKKEYYLKLAAVFMAGLAFRGDLAFEEQALCFPRTCQSDLMHNPVEVKRAQAAIAYAVIYRNIANISTDMTELDMAGRINSISLGNALKLTFADKEAATGNIFSSVGNNSYLLIQLELGKYLAQVRGGVVENEDDIFWHTLSTTSTTSTTSSTTSTSSSTTTT
jgi:hypothetical protein